MNDINLEKYRSAWKYESSFEEKKLSAEEISGFLRSSSKSILENFRRGLVFDIIIKMALLISFVILTVAAPSQVFINYKSVILIIIIISGLFWQFKVLRKISYYRDRSSNAINRLRDYISYYHKYYFSSIYVGALSSPLFFLVGSMYYLFNKYKGIPRFETDDFIVLSLGVILSFGLSLFVQIKQNNLRIKQLEKCLIEAKEETIDEISIQKYNKSHTWTAVIFGIALITGLILLLFLILNINS